ncbi:MAG: carbohydrate ABC transporter permease, partial [Chloroflexota bacterium]|nr:carbohydrate ABC transporter permease [Chloroflexota bacterium]
LVFIGREDEKTVTAAAATIGSRFNMDYPLVLAGLFLASVPPIVTYIILQRYIRRGLVLGAVK